MTDDFADSIIPSLAASLAPADRTAFRAAALAALAALPVEMIGPGSIHRTLEAAWRSYFHLPDDGGRELPPTRYRARRRASLAG